MFKLDKNKYDNTFSFYPSFDAQFVKKSETITFGPWNIIIAQQYIDVILSMCNKYKQLLHCYTPNS